MSDDAAMGIDSMIEALKQLPRDVMPRVYDEFAAIIGDDIKATARAGESPDGQAWQPRKSDGKAPMAHAADHIDIEIQPDGVLVRLSGPEFFHHTGRAKGRIKRPVIYTGPMPDRVAKKCEDAATKIISEVLGPHG